ncbi:volume-regulated anion channel subunit LRRC8B-like [Engraulis encrasicolus]|uniref:volume-regulated anion channel subunit LRRC8B-like n=1 Tax=Engraulis encrasicolus TaxID=184585 RepID=UPI002FD17480
MLSDGELKSLTNGHSLYRVLQPWWDVFCHYLSIMMFTMATLGCTLQLTLRRFICVPCYMSTVDGLCENPYDDHAPKQHDTASLPPNGSMPKFYMSPPSSPSPGGGGIYRLDLQQYTYVDAVCYERELHWFAKFFPYVVMLQTLVLVVISNFWFKYPSTSARLVHFVSILHKCFDSPWTTRALSETVVEQGGGGAGGGAGAGGGGGGGGGAGTSQQPSCSSVVDPSPSTSTTSSEERKMLGMEPISVLDRKEGEQAKAIFEKVKKLKVHVEDKDIVYHLYMQQNVAKMLVLAASLGYLPQAASHITFQVDCVVDMRALMPYRFFRCIHSLATIFWLLSLVYIVMIMLYALTCAYSLCWMVRNSLRHYSFDSVREDSVYSDVPDVKNDFAFILHLLDQYNPLFSKRFSVFLSEVSEKKLRQLNLNTLWPLEKLGQKVVRNSKDQLELHLMLLSGIPAAVFEFQDLEVLKLQLIPEARFPQKLSQLTHLSELWLDHTPATVDAMALAFLAKNLRILKLKFSEAEKAPSWVFSLCNLAELHLYGNLFSEEHSAFVSSLPKLKNLRVLFLRCSVTMMPKVVAGSMSSLQTLIVDNEGTQLLALQNLKSMQNLTCLKLINCDLQRIPSSIFSLVNVQEIDLEGNDLKTIEEVISFQHIPRLFTLKLKHNSITYIPVHIGVLESLEQLHLSHNHIKTIPAQLFLCTRLYYLDLSHNSITFIPGEIQNLRRLQYLNIANNNIDVIPDEVFHCRTLQSLLLDHNNLSSVPPQVSVLTNLSLLDLRGNQLESLPVELEECVGLRPGGLLVEEVLFNSLPPGIKEGFQHPLKASDSDVVLNTSCNLVMCNTGHGDSGLPYSV